MLDPRLSSAAWFCLSLAACGTAPAPPSAAPERSAPKATPAASPPAPAASAPGAADRTGGTVTIRGKTTPVTSVKLTKEGGEFYFYAHNADDEGIGVSLGAELKVGAKIQKPRGVMGHVLEDGKKLNVGDSSSVTFEATSLDLGTWEKPGKCSGSWSAEVKTPTDVIKASGTFKDVECYAL
ncbi:MAG: hypothetical protein IT377_15495 [Polyangiaceae bacterium]|nr:hypothetical protein [Polyangiaceae bacterium]